MEDEERQWALWMKAAVEGDQRHYRRLLEALVPLVTAVARACLRRNGRDMSELEDIVQESFLAIHLKRHLWDPSRPLVPWVRAITVNKTIDNMRRRGHRIVMPIETFENIVSIETPEPDLRADEIARLIATLRGNQKDLLEAVAANGLSVKEAAAKLGMTEGTARVTLHRAIKALAELHRRTQS